MDKLREETGPIVEKPTLLLKWGTVKGWSDFQEGECFELLKKYMEDSSLSCAMDNPDAARKAILCELIDKLDGTIWNDWDGREMTKDEAKEYVMGYDR